MPEDNTLNQQQAQPNQEPRTFSQDELNRIIQQRLREEQERIRAQYGLTPEEVAALKQAEEERRQAELTEPQRAQQALEAERKAKADLEARLKQMEIDAIRTRLIGAAEVKLPAAYQRLVEGTTEEEIQASLAEVIRQYQEDLQAAGVAVKQPMGASTNTGGRQVPDKPLSAYTSRELTELYQRDPAAYNRLFGR